MKNTLLVLDPGHGGTVAAGASSPNRGTGFNGLQEKDLALELARRTRDRLVGDVTVVLTREDDRNLSLADRAGTAKNLGADMFVSVHLSGTSNGGGNRTDVVVARQAPAATDVLAGELQRRVAAVTGAPGAVVRADLGQLAPDRHDPRTRACLVEVADITDAGQASLLADPGYLDRLADALAAGVRAGTASGAGSAPVASAMRVVTPDVDYSTTGLLDAVSIWGSWFLRWVSWRVGVPDSQLTTFPHAAICQLLVTYDSGVRGYGTAFYIADEVLLSCGHNFFHDRFGTATSVEVHPAWSPRVSTYPAMSYDISGRDLVHEKWRASWDDGFDLSVLRVPGLAARQGFFSLANMSLAPEAEIVVCGYGKVDGEPQDEQGQRMDGARISDVDWETLRYSIQTEGGHSGSPVFRGPMVIGVHTGAHDAHRNRAVLLNPDKIDWIVARSGGLVARPFSAYETGTPSAGRPSGPRYR